MFLPALATGGNLPSRLLLTAPFSCVRLVAQSCPLDRNLPGSPVPGHSSGKNAGVGSPPLLQEIFLIQELNRGLLHGRHILYQLSY